MKKCKNKRKDWKKSTLSSNTNDKNVSHNRSGKMKRKKEKKKKNKQKTNKDVYSLSFLPLIHSTFFWFCFQFFPTTQSITTSVKNHFHFITRFGLQTRYCILAGNLLPFFLSPFIFIRTMKLKIYLHCWLLFPIHLRMRRTNLPGIKMDALCLKARTLMSWCYCNLKSSGRDYCKDDGYVGINNENGRMEKKPVASSEIKRILYIYVYIYMRVWVCVLKERVVLTINSTENRTEEASSNYRLDVLAAFHIKALRKGMNSRFPVV